MPAVIPMPFSSSPVASQSFSLVGTGAPGFSDRLTPGPSVSNYNADVAAMSEQNRRMWVAAHGSEAGFPSSPFTSTGGAVYQGASNPGVTSMDLAEMSRQQAEMLSLQIAMQRENLMFTSISNILKTKHDTLKNIIGNIR